MTRDDAPGQSAHRDRPDAFDRALRWYPRSWRTRNGRIVADTMRQVAFDEGREAPGPGEQHAAFFAGIGTRINGDTAAYVAAAGFALGALIMLGLVTDFVFVSERVRILTQTLGSALVAFTGFFTLAAWLRDTERVSPGRALAAVLLALPAFVLVGLVFGGWTQLFDVEDGQIAPPLAQASPLLALTAAVPGVAACALLVVEAVREPRMPRTVRVLITVCCAPASFAVLAVASYSPYSAPGTALLALTAVALWQRPHRPAYAAGLRLLPCTPERPSRVRASRILSWAAAALGIVAVAFALLGSLIPVAGLDGTEAMRTGQAAGCLVAIVLVAAVSLRFPPSSVARVVAALGAVWLIGAGTIQFNLSRIPFDSWWLFAAAIVPLSAALVWLLLRYGTIRGPLRWILPACAAAMLPLLLGTALAVFVPYLAPIGAVVVALLPERGRRASRPVPSSGVVAHLAKPGAADGT